eukprot:scaffold4681_cov72-Cyclotella_meneghiniana.AAC.6
MPSLGWRKCTLSARDVCTGESSGGSSKADCCDGSLFSGECLAEKSRRVGAYESDCVAHALDMCLCANNLKQHLDN